MLVEGGSEKELESIKFYAAIGKTLKSCGEDTRGVTGAQESCGLVGP